MLITLTIIGVIAALTIPNMIAKHQKSQTEAGLKNFYSTINHAVKVAETEYGPVDEWIIKGKTYSEQEILDFVKKYFLPYLKYTKVEMVHKKGSYPFAKIKLQNGSCFMFSIDINGGDIILLLDGNTTHINTYNEHHFQFHKKISSTNSKLTSVNSIEPYTYGFNGQVSDFKTNSMHGCNTYSNQPLFCTKVIQLNGWKIPDDYFNRKFQPSWYGL